LNKRPSAAVARPQLSTISARYGVEFGHNPNRNCCWISYPSNTCSRHGPRIVPVYNNSGPPYCYSCGSAVFANIG
jgi:hypothetical protein